MKSFVLALILLTYLPSVGFAQTFEQVRSVDYRDWNTALLRNRNGGRLFCAAETTNRDGTIFRLNFYRDGDAFLEVFNPSWRLRSGAARFSLLADDYRLDLRGQSWSNSVTHDFVDERNTLLLIGVIMEANRLRVLNANGAPMGDFSLSGSSAALQALGDCNQGRF
ncbi:hypothetical protein [Octadecabacter sp. R77987]|uniref:hypothetical protein n=1 Tax=Octadecabacter sp. R77987 TaxID=3093874 RepID=UPI003670CCB3